MKKLLVWFHKHDTVYVDASTQKAEEAAYKYLFRCMQEEQFYYDLEDEEQQQEMKKELEGYDSIKRLLDDPQTPVALKEASRVSLQHLDRVRRDYEELQLQTDIYNRAKEGRVDSIRRLLRLRNDYEYERVTVVSVVNPLEVQ